MENNNPLLAYKDEIATSIKSKYRIEDEQALVEALNEAHANEMTIDEVRDKIARKYEEFTYYRDTSSLSANAFANIIIGDIINREAEIGLATMGKDTENFYVSGLSTSKKYNYLPKLDNLVQNLLADKRRIFTKMFIAQFGIYNFGKKVKGDLNVKAKATEALIQFQTAQGNINPKRLTNNSYTSDGIKYPNLQVDTKTLEDGRDFGGLLYTSDTFGVGRDIDALPYLHSFKLLQALSTKALMEEQAENVNGITLINNYNNSNIEVVSKTFDELRSPYFKVKASATGKRRVTLDDYELDISGGKPDYSTFVRSEEFAEQLRKTFSDYLSFIRSDKNVRFNFAAPEFNDASGNAALVKDNASDLSPNLEFEYYYAPELGNTPGEELTSEQKRYKFIASPMPTPSQLNSFIHNSDPKYGYTHRDPNIADKVAMSITILGKYGLTISQEQKDALALYYGGQPLLAEEKQALQSPAVTQEFDKNAQQRMDLGNHIEPILLERFAEINKGVAVVHTDKATLYSKTFKTPFDIDGYTGLDLNSPNTIVEIKNSGSKKYFENPEEIINAYKLQITYYNEMLSPSNGINFVASIKQGGEQLFFTKQVTISPAETQKFYDTLELWKQTYKEMHKSNLFSFVNLVNQKKAEALAKAQQTTKVYNR